MINSTLNQPLDYSERPRKTRRYGFIYFLKHHNTGLIKIGYTKWLRHRRNVLMRETGAYLQLLGYMYGGTRLEASLHQYFNHSRITGEWFEPHEDLLDFIAIFTTTKEYLSESRSYEERQQMFEGIRKEATRLKSLRETND